ncbi:Hypothetical predicted protein [Olea europaea subsp. europaea]|uniref:RNase H type-1 domain-containing protein n=1 Tax=Olea europaea subsp. europaea TaxID=158383 RepID=A0A8S0S860_OLEEU|nr:Hypothetical predicted protein [Olea europaea subsp. europaea]
MVLWDRNKTVHNGLPQSTEIVGEKSVITARHRFCFVSPAPSSISPEWRVPNMGELKINTGAAVQLGKHYIETGAVIRDHEGVVVAACSKRMVGGFQPEEAEAEAEAEAVALREGLLVAKNNGFKFAVAECDALRVIQCLHSEFSLTSYAAILYDIAALLEVIKCGTCCVIPRAGNQGENSDMHHLFSSQLLLPPTSLNLDFFHGCRQSTYYYPQ